MIAADALKYNVWH